jgi:hypothetical protein
VPGRDPSHSPSPLDLQVCPICFTVRKLDEGALTGNARVAGTTPLWQWIGSDSVAIFSY